MHSTGFMFQLWHRHSTGCSRQIKSIEVLVQTGKQVTYSIRYKGQQLVAPSPLNLVINSNDSLLRMRW